MDTKEEFNDEQLFKKIEQHNRNVNVVVSLAIVATMLIGVLAMRMYLMQANAKEVQSKIELEFEEDVKRFKKEIAENAVACEEVLPHHTQQQHKIPESSTFNHQSSSKKSKYADLHVDINTADTAELRKLPGIGEKRALNIVKFRTSLGGFYSVDQLAEVYSIDAELVEKLKKYIVCDDKSIVKIDVNNINPYKLWHPYLKGELVKTLKQKIKSGKRYKSFDEIKAEVGYDENLNGRAERYLEFR